MPAPKPHSIRALLKQAPAYASFKQLGHYPDYWWWKLRGEPRRIPHLVKQRAVLDYAQAFGLTTLIETGTYYGEMIAAMAQRFRRIYSIELDPRLAELARKRFRRYAHVRDPRRRQPADCAEAAAANERALPVVAGRRLLRLER